MAEARKWLYKIETRRDLDRIWPAFDEWFEASEEHRAAYAEARRRWLQLTGASPDRIRRIRSDRKPLLRPLQGWDIIDHNDLYVFLAVSAAILAMTAGQGDAIQRMLGLLNNLP